MAPNTIFDTMISQDDLTKQENVSIEERISRIEKLLEEKESPRAFELGLLLALKMGEEIRNKQPLGSTTGDIVKGWSEKYPSSVVEEAIASAKEFLLNPAKLAERIKANVLSSNKDASEESNPDEANDAE